MIRTMKEDEKISPQSVWNRNKSESKKKWNVQRNKENKDFAQP